MQIDVTDLGRSLGSGCAIGDSRARSSILAGVTHFIIPRAYRRIVPSHLPADVTLVDASGVADIAGGIGPASRTWRRPAGCG